MSIALNAPNPEASLGHPAHQHVTVRTDDPKAPIRHRRNKGHKSAPMNLSKVNADLVLRAFNTWAYKREQPDNIDILNRNIQAAIDTQTPLEFCLYWGKGPRSTISKAEIECLDYLSGMARRIQDVFSPGVKFTLIFTDTHARLNGHKPEAVQSYVDAVRSAAEARGFDGCFLSQLVADAEAAGCTPAPVPLHLLDMLSVTAAKWYRGEGSIELGALRYLEANMIEKRAVEHAFPTATFVTFNGGEMRELFPDTLPIFYMYSLRRGFAVKPWFIEETNAVDAITASLPDVKIAASGGQ
jgi:hypothetical protein